MQRNRRRVADVVPADHCENNAAVVISSHRVDDADDAEALDDAAVSALLESSTTFNADVAGVQPAGEQTKAAPRNPLLVPCLMVAALVSIVTIGFLVVASRAPGIASTLFFVFVVLIPFAVVSVIREEATLRQTSTTRASDSPER